MAIFMEAEWFPNHYETQKECSSISILPLLNLPIHDKEVPYNTFPVSVLPHGMEPGDLYQQGG